MFLLALIPFFGWAFGDLFAAIASRKIGGFSATIWSGFIFFILLSLVAAIYRPSHNGYTPILVMGNLVVGALLMFGNAFYTQGLEKSNASIVNVVAGSFPVITVLASVAFFGEKITFLQLVGIALAIVGAILASINLKEFSKGHFFRDPGLRFAIYAMILWGMYYALIKLFSQRFGWFWPTYISLSTFPCVYFFARSKKIKISNPFQRNVWLAFLLSVLFVRAAEASLNYALQSGHAAIVTPIAGSYPLLFVLLASIFFKDPITKIQKYGLAFGLAGIVVLAFVS